MARTIPASRATPEMLKAWHRRLLAADRLYKARGAWRYYARERRERLQQGLEPLPYGPGLWAAFEAAREEEANSVAAYRSACRKAGHIGTNGRTACPHIADAYIATNPHANG